MKWTRVSPYAGTSGIWTITEFGKAGESKFLLYKHDEIVGRFDTKDDAKAAAEKASA